MSYTSGRSIASTVRALPSPTRVATTATRKAIREVFGNTTGVTIKTRVGYDLALDTSTTVAVVTYPAGSRHEALAVALLAQADVLAVRGGDTAMTITRRA